MSTRLRRKVRGPVVAANEPQASPSIAGSQVEPAPTAPSRRREKRAGNREENQAQEEQPPSASRARIITPVQAGTENPAQDALHVNDSHPPEEIEAITVAQIDVVAPRWAPTASLTSASKLPAIKEFGSYPPTLQYGKFLAWIDIVKTTLTFASDWDESVKANWFKVVCGETLTKVISSHKLVGKDPSKPFSSLVEALVAHFHGYVDAALNQRAFDACRQEPGETASDYFIRLSQLAIHMSVDEERLKAHYVNNLYDKEFGNLAITSGWDLNQIVSAATRKETIKAEKVVGSSEGLVAAVDQNFTSKRFGSREKEGSNHGFLNRRSYDQRNTGRTQGRKCQDCGIVNHRNGVCPARGKDCKICKRIGHFAVVCPNKNQGASTNPERKRTSLYQVSNDNGWSD